jgi:outer membrane protein assembly factor BamB/tetratricopeptide (TPR) repeat protein
MTRSRILVVALTAAGLLLPAAARSQVTPDAKAGRKLTALQDYAGSEDWKAAVEVAQGLLDLPQDVFVRRVEKGQNGAPLVTLVGARAAANAALGAMPRDKPGQGLDVYQTTYGPRAEALLKQAVEDKDRRTLADVAERYLWTDAGARAAECLALALLDDGDAPAAARAFDRLLQRVAVDKLEPLTLYRAALAFHKGGTKEDQENKDKVWKQLVAKAPKGLRIDGRDRTLKELEEDLKKSSGPAPARLPDWPMFGGTPSRDGQGAGGAPFLQALWRHSLIIDSKQAQDLIGNDTHGVLKHLEMKGEAVIPAAVPVAATPTMPGGKQNSVLIFRTYDGVQSRESKTGAQVWRMTLAASLEKMLGGQTGATVQQWVQQFTQAGKSGVLIENLTIGTMSSDGAYIYCIDDLAVPPHVQQNFDRWGGMPPPGAGGLPAAVSAAARGNRLQAISVQVGKLQWTLPALHGSDADGFRPKSDFRDSHFLGAPLPVGGKLYFLNEKEQEIRLVCLDTGKLPDRPQEKDVDDAVAWVQPLATAKEKLLADYRRRINASHIAYGDGILVCPTNAGALIGVDPLTHSLLWAHVYGESAPPARGPAPLPPRRGIPPPGPAVPSTEWKGSAPVVQAGKVVFTPADGPELRCLSLRDGHLLWDMKAGADDVYFAGVYAGRVLVVGKKDVRALRLDDGKEAWRVPTGLPSGRGVASDNIYYLPLKDANFSDKEKGPGIFAIDVKQGKVVAQTRSKKDPRTGAADVPGNLLFFDGLVISQTATELVAYPQLKAKIGEMDELLKKNPNDPRGLLGRGELRLEQGNLQGAVEDFHAALANKPDDDLRRRLRAKLYDALTDLLARDFAAGEKFLKEYEELSREPVDPMAPPEERVEREAERERRLVRLLSLKGRGYEAQGKAVEALNTYLELAALKDGTLAVFDEPALKASPAVWARGRIAALYAAAKGESRQQLDQEIDKRGAALRKGEDVAALRAFVATFSPAFAAGREAHLALAERLMDRDGKADLLEAEQLLLKLSAQTEDRPLAGRALESLARTLSRRGLIEDALQYYRTLARDYPTTVIRDGKTGAQIFEELKTDKRFVPYLDAVGEALGKQRFKAEEERDKNFPQQAQHMLYTFDPLDDPLPSLKHRRVAMNYANNHLMVVGRRADRDAKPEVDEPINESFQQFMTHPAVNLPPGMAGIANPPAAARFGYHSVGHLVVVNLGQYVAAIDTVTHRLLWAKNLLGSQSPAGNGSALHYNPTEEALQLIFSDGIFMTVGQAGPVSASYVCVQTRDGLAALDPLTGKTLWTRNDVPMRCRLFGDDKHIYLVEMNNAGATTGTRAFRAPDGASVDVPPFAPLFQKRQCVLGGQLLVADNVPAGGTDLRLYDVQSGKDLWKQHFPAGTVMLSSEDPDLAGAIAPDGRVTVVNLRQRKVVLGGLVANEHMKNLHQAHLLADAQSIYVALYANNPANPPQVWSNLQATTGMRAITVNGQVYAFDRRTCKIRWWNQVENQQLVLEQWKEMPVLLFTSRSGVNPNGPRAFAGNQAGTIGVEAWDKATGKVFYRQPVPGQPQLNPQSGPIYAINYDADGGKIEMIAPTYKITITRQGETGR